MNPEEIQEGKTYAAEAEVERLLALTKTAPARPARGAGGRRWGRKEPPMISPGPWKYNHDTKTILAATSAPASDK